MEPLNNDMDDLFRKAGDLYPLKTSGSDWDGVLGKLHDQSSGDLKAVPALKANAGRNRRRWLFLLLLIPIGLGSVFYFYSGNKTQHPDKVNEIIIKQSPSGGANQTDGKSASTDIGPAANAEIKNLQDALSKQNSTGLKSPGKPGKLKSGQNQFKKGRSDMNLGEPYANDKPSGEIVLAAGTGITITENKLSKIKSNPAAESNAKVGTDSLSGTKNAAPVADTVQTIMTSADQLVAKQPDQQSAKDSLQFLTKKTDAQEKSSKGIYIGFLIGPDWSTVKFQSVKQTGLSLGILAGYRFNKRLAIETGLIWDRKYYYSSGEYFKNSPPYSSSTTIDGNCNMIEIPLVFRYEFSPEYNHGFFVKGGFSSYLMTHQYYSTQRYGAQTGAWPVNDFISYPFSVVDLSGGYAFPIGGKTKIQIEPYIKIPLKGVGEGSLPISSAGIYFGISHSFR